MTPPARARITVSNGVSIVSTLERREMASTHMEPRPGWAHTSTFSIRAFASRMTTLGVAPPGSSLPVAVGRAAALATCRTASSRAVVAAASTAPIAHRLRRGIRTASLREQASSLFRCSRAQMAPARMRVSCKGWIWWWSTSSSTASLPSRACLSQVRTHHRTTATASPAPPRHHHRTTTTAPPPNHHHRTTEPPPTTHITTAHPSPRQPAIVQEDTVL